MAEPRILAGNAAPALALYDELFGPNLEHTDYVRAVLGRAVAEFRAATGANRVIGFELPELDSVQ